MYKRYYKPFKEETLKETYAFIPALPKDNPSPEAKEYIDGILNNADKTTIERLIYGNFEYDDDPAKLMDYDSIVDIFSNDHVGRDEKGKLISNNKYITADIARLGKDKTEIFLWDGMRGKHLLSMDKNTITEAAAKIREFANANGVPISRVIVDEDGIGGGVKDILRCKGFVNNSVALPEKGSKTNYSNLKSQCYFKMAKVINNKEMYIDCGDVVKELTSEELEVVKRKDFDKDGKVSIEGKDKVKELIGRSPDYSDAIAMRMWFDINKKGIRAVSS